MLAIHLLRLLSFFVFVHYIQMAGSPVLIKMDGKKSKGKGNLILISGGKCGSPTLIKGGGDKKKGGELILVGGQNGDCDKPKVHYVKQFVPIPYYIPKPIYKYILRHHYVPVRQVVVKTVPVPVHVKSHYSGGEYKSSGSAGNSYSASSSGGGGYQDDMAYDDKNYAGSNLLGKYAHYDKSALAAAASSGLATSGSGMMSASSMLPPSEMMPSSGHDSSSGGEYITGNSYKAAQSFYDGSYLPSSPSANKVTLIASPGRPSSANSHSQFASSASGNMKESSSDNYYYQTQPNGSNGPNSKTPQSNFNDDYGSRLTGSATEASEGSGRSAGSAGFHLAPVYEGPNGQLFSNGRVLTKEFLNSNSVVQAFPTFSKLSSSAPGQPKEVDTNMNKDVLRQYKAEIEEAKKLFTGISNREDSSESSSSSSSSEEESKESKSLA